MAVVDFSFDEYATEFDAHISASIPGYDRFNWWVEGLSRRFVQSGTRVVDLGCSTGAMLCRVRDANRQSRQSVDYVGIDVARSFEQHWCMRRAGDLRFNSRDALEFEFSDVSLVIASFFLQFVPERRKIGLLQRIYDGLVDGGALFIAEKTLAGSSTLQDLIVFTYYDHKLSSFSAEEILNKERRLRGVMTPWTRARLVEALCAVGFCPQDIESFWQEGPFIALVAMKRARMPVSNRGRQRLLAA
jgi:tRNA (cmo5U34)-methyltransferase